jgi:hypothetical protein
MHTSDANQITNGRATEAREAPVVANDRRTWISLEPRYEPPRPAMAAPPPYPPPPTAPSPYQPVAGQQQHQPPPAPAPAAPAPAPAAPAQTQHGAVRFSSVFGRRR